MKVFATLVLFASLASAAMAGAAYTNTAFGYRLETPTGWVATGDAAAASVILAGDAMRAKITTGKRPAAVTEELSDRLRQRDETALAARTARWKRVPFAAETPGPGARWAYAYRSPQGAALITVASLFSYPHDGGHVWVRLQLQAPLAKAKEAGNHMRALLRAFAFGSAPVAAQAVNAVGKGGPADFMLLDDTGTLSRVTFEAAPLTAELEQYQRELFQPTVAMEAKLAQLFDDVTVRAERKELTPTGKTTAFREIVGRYKKLLDPLEASVPTNADLAQAHQGVVGFYRERAGIYERIVEATASSDSAALNKAVGELSQHAFQNTQAYQQLNALLTQPQPPQNDVPPPLAEQPAAQ